tara:strand:+ start:69 stop:458 length:390 start_codon:yes stop_codon:yes gene_type:complete
MADKNKINTVERPMSPHLQVYRISFTMMMSMMHRISGFILYLGSFIFLLWYLSIFFGEGAYNFLNYFFSFIIIKIALFLYTWVFFHHLFGGIRHFIWDFGFGFELNSIEWLARLTAIFSFTSASLLWLL